MTTTSPKPCRLRQAVILAGGLETPAQSLTDNFPKPMLPVLEQPFLVHMIEMLKRNGVEEVVLLLGYLPERITEYFDAHPIEGVMVRWHVGSADWDTGTRVQRAQGFYDETFLLSCSDSYWPLNVPRHMKLWNQGSADWLVTSFRTPLGSSQGNLVVGQDGKVLAYDSTRSDCRSNGVDIGFFVMRKSIVRQMPDTDFHLTHDFLPRIIAEGRVVAFETDQKTYSIGSLERLLAAERYLKPKKIVFLNRDGVINVKTPRADSVKTESAFQFLDGALEALRLWKAYGYSVVILSHQAGIASGIMAESDLKEFHDWMKERIRDAGGQVGAIYYCPHSWDEGCVCRKPQPGMLFQASVEREVELRASVLIGDETDVEAGEAAGIPTLLVGPGRSLYDLTRSYLEHGRESTLLVERVLRSLREGRRCLVAIGGPSRAGKTTLSRELAESLRSAGTTVALVELDHFLKGVERSAGTTVRERYDYEAIDDAVRALFDGETVKIPVYDQARRRRRARQSIAGTCDVILIEGVVALDVADIQPLCSLRVFVDASTAVRKCRSLELMTQVKGLSDKEALALFAQRETEEMALIQKGRWNADLLFQWEPKHLVQESVTRVVLPGVL